MNNLDFECPECGEIFNVVEPDCTKPIGCPYCGYNGCKVVLLEADALRARVEKLERALTGIRTHVWRTYNYEAAVDALEQIDQEARRALED